MSSFQGFFARLLRTSLRLAVSFCILSLMFEAGVAQAQTVFSVDGIKYKTLSSFTVQVGDGTNRAISRTQTSCVIPDTVSYGGTNYTVTSIGECAFSQCMDLLSVKFPTSLTSIGSKAFYYSYKLTSVTFPTSLTSIGESAFEGCERLTSVVFPASLTSIGRAAFSECWGLTSVVFPTSLTSIGDEAFFHCPKLTSVTLPDSLTNIGNKVFSYCFKLTSVKFPTSLTSIGEYAFAGCSGLTSIVFPASLTSIGWSAFYKCSGLTSVTLPDSLTSLRGCAFEDCSSLISVTFPTSLTIIESYAFSRCSSLTSVTLPASLTSIGDGAFYGCSGLTSVPFPDSLTIIGDYAFYSCTSLTSVTFPALLTRIGSEAFHNCTSLTSVTLPDSLTNIGGGAFSDCSGLVSVTLPATLTSLGDGAFYNCTSLTSVPLPATLTSLGGGAFSGCLRLTSITLPDSLTKIESFTFEDCLKLSSLTLPKSLTSIGDWAFSNCMSLTSVTLPDSLTSLGGNAFEGCTGLTSVTLPPALRSIGNRAFSHCSILTSVTLPASLTSLGERAFYMCYQLSSINYFGTKEPSIGDNSFLYGPSVRVLYVPNATSGFVASQWKASSIVYGAQDFGSVRTSITGPVGARWKVAGISDWNASDVTFPNIAVGTYLVDFSDVADWTTPASAVVTVTKDTTATTSGTYTVAYDMILNDGDFSAGTVTPLAPGRVLDFKWDVNTNNTFGSSQQFWCEAHASKTGGFDLSRLGGTVTQSHVQSGLSKQSNIINPGDQLLNMIPDGRYTLVPMVNPPARPISLKETNYFNNWMPIAGKRLSVRNTTPSGVDLVLENTTVNETGDSNVTVVTQVRNAGNSAMTGAGCWVEAFYGYMNAEGDVVPEGPVGPGQLVSGLGAGATASYTLNGNVNGDVLKKAIFVIVDSTDIVPEPDKVNNSFVWYMPSILPPGKSNGIDLKITSMTLNSKQLAPTYQLKPGDKLNYSVTIKNDGATLSTPVWLELFASQDGCGSRMRGASLTESEYLTMPKAGQSQTYQLSQTINSIGDGMYSVMAIVNRDGQAGNPGDMTPLNNRRKFSGGRISLATPTESGNINLIWKDDPVFAYARNTGYMTVSGTVINMGADISRGFWVEPFVGHLEPETGMFVKERPLTGGIYCDGLAAVEMQEIRLGGYVGPGKVVGILIDGTDLVGETDETDNYDYSELTD